MFSGAGSQARGSDPGSRRQDGHGSLVEPRAEAPRKEVCREDLQSCKLSPTSGQNPKGPPSHPSWVKQPGQEETKASPGLLSIPEPLGTGSRAATGPLAWLSRRQEARLPFSRFLDEVAVRVLDPRTLEAFRGSRGRSPEPSPGEQDPGLAQEPLAGASAPEKTLALSPQLSSEVAPEAASRGGPGRATETSVPRMGSSKRGGPAASPQRPPSPVSLSPRPSPRGQLGRGLLGPLPCSLDGPFPHKFWLTPSELPHHPPFIITVAGKTLSTQRMKL